MVDRNLIREFNVSEDELNATLGDLSQEAMGDEDGLYTQTAKTFDVNQITEGTVIRVDGDEVLVDIGYKSEGIVTTDEWSEEEEPPSPGDKIQVLLEEVEDDFGLIMLSKRKTDRIREWEQIIDKHKEGDVVSGAVIRKIKGGLLVNIGVNVFLPASQVDIRRPQDIATFIGRDIECVILKIDEARRNIVVSRRKLIEDKRKQLKDDLLSEISEGHIRKGVVKNIADFGAFVDLGGIDGLLHITDMSWGRISHPSDMLKIDDEIEVMILNIDREREKIALGLKQKEPSPWDIVEERYPVGGKVTGEVVNVMTYGAFVKLEDGIEGLVHISEMSWTKRINHPTELVNIGEEVEVVILGINKDKQEISLGMKQTQANPWDDVVAKYPPGTNVSGTVRNLTNYGAFIELEEGVDGLLHVSDMSWTRKISHASEMLKKGMDLECQVLSVDEERKRIALGLKQLEADPWAEDIPGRFQPGEVVKGKVTKVTNFGVFVELAEELEGLLHISELADHKVENPEEVVSIGEDLEVRVLRVDTDERKIGLSLKLDGDVEELVAEAAAGEGGAAVPKREELLGGTGVGGAGPLFSMAADEPAAEEAVAEEAATEEPAAEAEEAVAEETAADDAPAEENAEEPAAEEAADDADDSSESAEEGDEEAAAE
ncbi:MAG: 30S ribosomal protein S1 [Planctomycetaceae bacterium]|nr:30S ribosomal protein S1 [Planctomycetaceae bacterium]